MNYLPIDASRDAVPIRLFKSDFLEFFTHISPIAIIVLWLPIAVLLIVYATLHAPGPEFPIFIPLGFLIGLFLWTLAEYTGHRFLFHHKPTSPRQERILFLFHGIHHAQPQVKTRLVLPFPISITMAAIFFGLFYLILAVLLQTPPMGVTAHVRFPHRLPCLRSDPLRHAPPADAFGLCKIHQALPHAASLQGPEYSFRCQLPGLGLGFSHAGR